MAAAISPKRATTLWHLLAQQKPAEGLSRVPVDEKWELGAILG
jgi:hypothetical protein